MKNILNLIKENTNSDLKINTFLNPYSYFLARSKLDLFKDFNLFVDGALLVMLLRFIGVRVIRNSFDMTSLAPIILDNAQCNKKSIFLIGGESDVAKATVIFFKRKYPELIILGSRDGFFNSSSERADFIRSLSELNPDILIAGMGTPYQEQLLLDLTALGWQGSGYTCGGFFHQTAKSGLQYYPKWIDNLNLRWLYRMYDEPKLIKRYFLYYPLFLMFFAYDAFLFKLHNNSR